MMLFLVAITAMRSQTLPFYFHHLGFLLLQNVCIEDDQNVQSKELTVTH